MKNFLLYLFFFLCSLSALSQTEITLIFVGKDAATQNLIPLDSVTVKNLNQNCDTAVYGPVPVLSLIALGNVGIEENSSFSSGRFILKQNYPNPFQGSTIVNIFREYSGELNLILFDGIGKKLASYQNNIEKGYHSFAISSSGNQVLLLVMFDEKNNRSIKLISTGQSNDCNTIQYLGNNSTIEIGNFKSIDNTGFIFYLGDQLLYTAHANGFNENFIIDNPVDDSTYYFDMSTLSLPTVITSPISNITQTAASCGGTVTSDGGASVTARGICWSTSANPTLANSYTLDGSGMGSFVSSLTGLSSGTTYYVRAYATNSVGTAYGNEQSFPTSAWSCGTSFTINHVAGNVAPVDKTVTYGTVTNIPGETSKCWITSNLGADHQATSVTDATEASAGWYWKFNQMQGYKHDGTAAIPAWTVTSINENSDWLTANDPCAILLGNSWRLPTYTELFNVDASGSWTNRDGPWNSPLKMHAAGYLLETGSPFYRGERGEYWSSTQYDNSSGRFLDFGSVHCFMNYILKYNGLTCRCIKDSPNASIPTVTTSAVTNITSTTATSGGDVTSDGGASVTAKGVCWSTSANPTLANSYTLDGSGMGSFVSSLSGLSSGTTYYVRAYATNSVGTAYGNELSFPTLWSCGTSFTINHVTGSVAPVDKTVTYGTVTNIPGETSKCWITSNLGADHQASAVNDATEASAGWYWQFNRKQGYKHDGTTRTPNTAWIYPINENLDWTNANDPCSIELGGDWRIPTYTEWFNVDATGNWTDLNGPWNSALKMHAAGSLDRYNGSRNSIGTNGAYWSGSQCNAGGGETLQFLVGISLVTCHDKGFGMSIRCIKDSPNASLPTVTTNAVTDITSTTATSGGTVTSDGGASVTARGVCWSTSANPTLANSYTIDGSGTGSFVSSLTGLSSSTTYYVRAYATNSVGTAYGNEQSFPTSAWSCGTSFTINHVAGNVAPVDKTVTYGTVTNIPGETSKCWITSNLGADHQATSVNDATEASAGWYWQFNRKQGFKHDGTTRTPNTLWITSINENLDWQTANDPCAIELGSGWRIPTSAEWTNVDATGNWNDWNGPWNSPLKLHAAGQLYYTNGAPEYRGIYGLYWSASQNSTIDGRGLRFMSANSTIYTGFKADCNTLRCVNESTNTSIPTVTTSAATNITSTTATSGGDVTSDGGASVTARGVCWSTSANPTLANSYTLDGSGTGSFVSSLTGLSSGTTYYVRAYATNSVGTAYGNEQSFPTSTWSCGTSFTINHVTGSVAPVDKTVTYGTVTNIPGETSKCWITSNLGADHQATSVTDATEASAGWYWKFNQMQGYKHDGTAAIPAWTVTSINENSDWLTANDPCAILLGNSWRLPTYTELFNVDASGSWTNRDGPWNSPLKMHAAGYLLETGSPFYRGERGEYWSSTQYNNSSGRFLDFGSVHCFMNYILKYNGLTCRCIKD